MMNIHIGHAIHPRKGMMSKIKLITATISSLSHVLIWKATYLLSLDPSKAMKELGFKAEKTIDEMCKDAYNFVKKNI